MAIFKHTSVTALLLLLATTSLRAEGIDLLADGANGWEPSDAGEWTFESGELTGRSQIFDGEKTDPAASAFIVSKEIVGGDYALHMEVTFSRGRYIGVYLDFSQSTQTGIWMATGHPVADDAPDNEVPRGYVKTVSNGDWIVRSTGQIDSDPDERLHLTFTRHGMDYGLWQDDRLIATYRATERYLAGPVQLRLVNASARIHKLVIEPVPAH